MHECSPTLQLTAQIGMAKSLRTMGLIQQSRRRGSWLCRSWNSRCSSEHLQRQLASRKAQPSDSHVDHPPVNPSARASAFACAHAAAAAASILVGNV